MSESTEGLHVVVGASGGTGSAIVRELNAAGRRVRAVNRSGRMPAPPGVEVVAADATDAAQMRRACAGAAVVHTCVNPPFTRWRELFPAAVDGVLVGAGGRRRGARVRRTAPRGRTARWSRRPSGPPRGGVGHIPHPDPLTGHDLVGTIFAAAGCRTRVSALGTTAVRALGLVSPLARHGAEMIYQFEMPFVVDGSRFQQAFGAGTTPVEDAVRATLDWYRTNTTSRSPGR